MKWIASILFCIRAMGQSFTFDDPAFVSQGSVSFVDTLINSNAIWFKLDETSGLPIADSTTNGTGGFTLGAHSGAKFNNGLLFNGTSGSYASITNNAVFQLTNKFSISIWASAASSADTSKYLFSKRNTGDEYAIVYGFNAGKYEFYSEQFTGTNPRTPLASTLGDTAFHNIIWTYDGSNLKGYWDGTLSTNRSITFSLTTGSGNLILGSSTGFANNFFVTVDDLRIWYRVLTDPEIAQLQTQQ